MNQKKRVTWFLFSVCFLCMLFAVPVEAKGKKPASKNVPKKIVLNQKEILMYPGEEKKVAVELVKPEEASPDVTWKSKKKAVASVSKEGKIRAKKPGKVVITAVSKKNPKVTAVVKVKVKKRPEKREKECGFEGKSYSYTGGGIENDYAREKYPTPVIFRSKGDIFAYAEEAYEEYYSHWPNKKKYASIRGRYQSRRRAVRSIEHSFLSKYFKMDFEKESLVVFFNRSCDVVSLQTRFDAEGKLRATAKFRYYPPQPEEPGTLRPAVITYHATVLKLRRQDEAMIDYYEFEREEMPQAE